MANQAYENDKKFLNTPKSDTVVRDCCSIPVSYVIYKRHNQAI